VISAMPPMRSASASCERIRLELSTSPTWVSSCTSTTVRTGRVWPLRCDSTTRSRLPGTTGSGASSSGKGGGGANSGSTRADRRIGSDSGRADMGRSVGSCRTRENTSVTSVGDTGTDPGPGVLMACRGT